MMPALVPSRPASAVEFESHSRAVVRLAGQLEPRTDQRRLLLHPTQAIVPWRPQRRIETHAVVGHFDSHPLGLPRALAFAAGQEDGD